MIKNYIQFIYEARSIKNYSDPTLSDVIRDLSKKYGKDSVQISFRIDQYVTDFNRTNINTTPTGYYFYPLSSIIDIDKVELPDKLVDGGNDGNNFEEIFPFIPSGTKYVDVIVLNNLEKLNIFTENTSLSKIDSFVKKIENKYGNDEKVKEQCDLWFKRVFKPIYYIDHSRASNIYFEPRNDKNFERTYETKHETHKFWYFLHKISEILTKTNRFHTYKKICNDIGINGFIDYGDSYINPLEPKQGVLFKLKKIIEYKYVHKLYDDIPNKKHNDFLSTIKKIKKNIGNLSDNEKMEYSSKLHTMIMKLGHNDHQSYIYDLILRYPFLIEIISLFEYSGLEILNSEQIKKILLQNPEFINYFNYKFLSDDDKKQLIKKHQSLKDKLLVDVNKEDIIKKYLEDKNGRYDIRDYGIKVQWIRDRYEDIDDNELLFNFLKKYEKEAEHISDKKFYDIYKKYLNELPVSKVRTYRVNDILDRVILYKKGDLTKKEIELIKNHHNILKISEFFYYNPQEIKNMSEYKTVHDYVRDHTIVNILTLDSSYHKYFDLKNVTSGRYYNLIYNNPELAKYFDFSKLDITDKQKEALIDEHPYLDKIVN